MLRKALIILALTHIFTIAFYAQNTVKVEKIAGNFEFTEGPLWVDDSTGYLLFSDVSGDKIYKWQVNGGTAVYLNSTGNSNGLAVDNEGHLLLAQQGSRQIGILENGEITTFVSKYKGKRLNSPNDLTVNRNTGAIYFTDPTYGIGPGEEELDFSGVYCIPPGKSEPVLLIDSLAKPNGIALSPDGWFLYVCDSESGKVFKLDLRSDTAIESVSLFASFGEEIDGIKTDLDGNVYVAVSGYGIKILNYSGELINSVSIPEKTRNLAWGGKYRIVLFVTAGESLYKVSINPGNPFIMNEFLGRPTERSVTLNMLSERDVDVFVRFGTSPDNLDHSTDVFSPKSEIPFDIIIDSLMPNSEYFYRVMYREASSQEFLERATCRFRTQRPAGSSFTFDVQADPHLDISSNYITYLKAMENTLSDGPDFMLDLGDNFMTDKLPVKSYRNIVDRMFLLRHFYDKVAHSVPVYLVIGNHEGENGWELNGSSENVAVWNTNGRKLYFPNPCPDTFYSGDSAVYQYTGIRESYYSWTWGDALFVVLDPYWHTTTKPTQSKDGWDWTLGKEQYDWLKATLESGRSKYKFVFCHQIIGGDNEGRGGTEAVPYYEMGGKNSDGTYGFDKNRPGWGKPIHQLFVDNGVNIFFHGHDHLFVKQELDGVIYQLVPQPSLYNYTGVDQADKYGYSGTIFPNSGHIRVSVKPDSAVVDYVRAYHVDKPKKNEINGKIEYSYTVLPHSVDRVETNYSSSSIGLSVTPNPGSDRFRFEAVVPDNQPVTIEIIDLTGRPVRSFPHIEPENGRISLVWDCKDNANRDIRTGTYLCCLKTTFGTETVIFTIIK